MSLAGPHRRQNLLTGDWVLVSPHRLDRPWQGAASPPQPAPSATFDPGCYLCPGNARAGGRRNPDYRGVHVFDNDFPALLQQSEPPPIDDLLIAERETGVCRVLCYTPDHSRAFARLSEEEALAVVRVWSEETRSLMARRDISAVTIFENRGAMMGASNPHPHGQIWATRTTPQELAREAANQDAYHTRTGRPLLGDYLAREESAGERLILGNDHWAVVAPFWAAWPFEVLILPRRAVGDLTGLLAEEGASLARLLPELARLFDAIFDAPFPCTFGWHQRPKGAGDGFTLHAHVYPPLLRSAAIRKFMVGFEMLAMPQRDLTPEAAAERMREAAAKARRSRG